MIILKSKREIEYIREAGRITANALQLMKKLAKPGITTGELDQLAAEAEGTDAGDVLIDRYHFLRDFAKTHAEAGVIFAAID